MRSRNSADDSLLEVIGAAEHYEMKRNGLVWLHRVCNNAVARGLQKDACTTFSNLSQGYPKFLFKKIKTCKLVFYVRTLYYRRIGTLYYRVYHVPSI